MTNPDEWGTSLVTVSSPYLVSFQLFEAEIRRTYGDKNRRLNTAIKTAGEYLQGYANQNETVQSYANRIRTNWHDAGWDETTHAPILYDLAWAGLRPHIRARIRPFASEASGKFESIDQLFDKAVGAESKTNPGWKPRNEAGPNQQKDSGRNGRFDDNSGNNSGKSGNSGNNSGSNSGNTDRSWRPTGGQSNSKLPPVPWVSIDVLNKRKAAGECGRCGGNNHKHYHCPKYSPARFPDHLKVNQGADNAASDGHQLKRQKSFDSNQAKN